MMVESWHTVSTLNSVPTARNTKFLLFSDIGFYKAIQSAGAAGVFKMDSSLLPYMTILLTSWILAAVGIICVIPVLILRVTDHTDSDALLKGDDIISDEKIDEESFTTEKN